MAIARGGGPEARKRQETVGRQGNGLAGLAGWQSVSGGVEKEKSTGCAGCSSQCSQNV